VGAYTERMPSIHIDPAASNNRGDGSSAGTAWRDAEELSRRLGRGTSLFRQATTITIHGSLNSNDYLNLKAAVAPLGNLKIVGNRGTAVLTGTISAKTDYTVGSQVQQVTGTGLSAQASPLYGARGTKQIVITNSATPGNIGAIAHLAKDLTGNNVRTSTFAVPPTTGLSAVPTIVLPLVGDSFAVYNLPTVPLGTVEIEPAGNTNSLSTGTTGGFAMLQYMHLKGDQDSTATASYASSLRLHAWRCFLLGSYVDHVGVTANEAQTVWLTSHANAIWFAGGQSFHQETLFTNNPGPRGTQLIRSHYMDVAQAHCQGGGTSQSGVAPYCYAGSTMILNRVSIYDSLLAAGIFVNPNSLFILLENNVWGSGHATYGVDLVRGSKIYRAQGSGATLTGTLGDIRRQADFNTTSQIHSWTEGIFEDAFGTGVQEY
jgi:hypothetical protein